jgi:hypothetical protein
MPVEDVEAPRLAQLRAEAEAVRGAIGSKRSDKLLRLFDFLLERTIEQRPPTEVEIAETVFSMDRTLDVSQDATVRVYVHRLRKKLEEIYSGKPGPRLHIPKGEYSLTLTPEAGLANGDEAEQPSVPSSAIRSSLPWKTLWIGLAALFALNLAAWWAFVPDQRHERPSGLARTALWKAIAEDERPITIVLGDYYFFAEAQPKGEAPTKPQRLILNPSISSSDDLYFYLMLHPENVERVADLNLHYVPSSAVVSLREMFSAIGGLSEGRPRPATMIPASQLTPDILKSSDVVYVGLISGLGRLLRNPLFQASGFSVGATYNELIDNATGQRYASDGVVSEEERIARRDYGYLASLPGPTGNHLVIIAGTRDAALLQMAELASDTGKLRQMNKRAAARPEGFEALYQVRTMGNLNLSGRLLVERPLKSRGIWDMSNDTQRFPNDTYEGGGKL